MASAGKEHSEIAGNQVPSIGSTNTDALTATELSPGISNTKLTERGKVCFVFSAWYCSEAQLNYVSKVICDSMSRRSGQDMWVWENNM